MNGVTAIHMHIDWKDVVMPDINLRIGDIVIIEASALKPLLDEEHTLARKNQVLTDTYRVTGVGRTCVGVRGEKLQKGFNVPKPDVLRVKETPQPMTG